MSEIIISSVTPQAALPGGEVLIHYRGLNPPIDSQPEVRFGDFTGQITVASSDEIVVKVPESCSDTGTAELLVRSGTVSSAPYPYEVGKRLATNLHPVANPAIDTDGNVYVTYSGRRGQQAPVSIYKVSPQGAITPFTTEIMNATGLAFGRTGHLYVSSRFEGNVYRVDPLGRTDTFVEGMGVATGLAFDRYNNLYVGDRSGSIFKISPTKEIFVFATLEPSIAAYHLAFGADDHLYVTGPTTSSFDTIYRISPNGEVDKYFTGVGRPQGLTVDLDGNIYAVASYRGRRGIFRFLAGVPELVISGIGLVGVAFDLGGNALVADESALYRVHLGIPGRPLP